MTTGEEALEAAKTIGLPVLLKATGGGGGIGIHICRSEDEVVEKFNSAARQGAAAFGDSGVFVEKYVQVSQRDFFLYRIDIYEIPPTPQLIFLTVRILICAERKAHRSSNFR